VTGSRDAFLLVSFGGPEAPAHVMPFLENVTRGRGIPPRRLAQAGPGAPRIDKIGPYFDHPGFIEPLVPATLEAIGRLPWDVAHGAHLVFTAHSIPQAMAAACGPPGTPAAGRYAGQLTAASRLIAARVGGFRPWQLVYQSRSGPSAKSSPAWSDRPAHTRRGYGAPPLLFRVPTLLSMSTSSRSRRHACGGQSQQPCW
jgi:protoheme ferro-lyase